MWSFCHGRQTVAETLAQVAEVTTLAEAVAARARTALRDDPAALTAPTSAWLPVRRSG